MQAGADPCAANRAGEMPLHMACRNGASVDLVRQLTARAGSVNVRGARGRTALHEAVLGGSREMVLFLCEVCGADISAEADDRLTPVDLASSTVEVPEGVRNYLQEAREKLPSRY